jgi:hypothetical protein
MKNLMLSLVLAGFISLPFTADAQHRHRGRGKVVHKHVVVKRSPYRPRKVVVFHPRWAPAHAYHRRWVFFPGRNLYWDNWRNHYVFYNGTVWISQPAPPPGITENELEKEKRKELKEEEDDVDDVYKSNEEHKKD